MRTNRRTPIDKRIVTALAAAALVLTGCSDETNSAAEQPSSYNEAASEVATENPAADVAASELDNDAVTLEQGAVRVKTG